MAEIYGNIHWLWNGRETVKLHSSFLCNLLGYRMQWYSSLNHVLGGSERD